MYYISAPETKEGAPVWIKVDPDVKAVLAFKFESVAQHYISLLGLGESSQILRIKNRSGEVFESNPFLVFSTKEEVDEAYKDQVHYDFSKHLLVAEHNE